MGKYKVSLTAGAERDLDSILEHLRATAGEQAADAWLGGLARVVDSLETFPNRGAVPPELQELGIETFRQLLTLSPWRVIYRVLPLEVEVMVIIHAKRDFQSLLEERLLAR